MDDPRAQGMWGAAGNLGAGLLAAGMGDRRGLMMGMQSAMAAPMLAKQQAMQLKRLGMQDELSAMRLEQMKREQAAQDRLAKLVSQPGFDINDPAARAQLAQDPEMAALMVKSQLGRDAGMFAPRPAYDAQGNLVFMQASPAGEAKALDGFKPVPQEFGMQVGPGGQVGLAPGYVDAKRQVTAANQPSMVKVEGQTPEGAPTVAWWANPSAWSAGGTAPANTPTVQTGPGIAQRETMKAEATNVPEAARSRYAVAKKQLGVINDLLPTLEKYNPSLLERAGGAIGIMGPEAKEAEATRNSMLFAIAQLSEQGALQAPDRAVAESMIGELFDPRIGPETRKANIKAFRAWVDAQTKANEASVGTAAPIAAPTGGGAKADKSLLDKYAPQ